MNATPAAPLRKRLRAILPRSARTAGVVATAGLVVLLSGLALALRSDQSANQELGAAEAPASPGARVGTALGPAPSWPASSPTMASGTPLPCRAADLNVVWTGSNAATGGQLLGHIAAGNQTAAACVLQGMPALEVLGADGRRLGVRAQPCTPAPTTVDLFKCDPDAPVTLAPGRGTIVPHQAVAGQATLLLMWRIHDGAGFCPSPTPPTGPAATLQLTLRPSGDQVSVAVPQERGNFRSEADFLGLAACGGGVIAYFPFREVAR